ncbi:hypothetical protein JOD07_002106 [Defluviitalea raffinosedens]|nr:hypothetical protein [Defluviitalea raffinosedens]
MPSSTIIENGPGRKREEILLQMMKLCIAAVKN